jgi:prepilin-type N-terminal cleavage/methylation domain-containing protein
MASVSAMQSNPWAASPDSSVVTTEYREGAGPLARLLLILLDGFFPRQRQGCQDLLTNLGPDFVRADSSKRRFKLRRLSFSLGHTMLQFTKASSHGPDHQRGIDGAGCKPFSTARDSGFSIVEVICAISLIGIVVIPLVQATFTSIATSSTTREVAEIETVLQNAADRVNRATTDCNYKIYIEAAAKSKGWPADRASATYQYYVPGSTAEASTPGQWRPGGCLGSAPTPGLVQLVTVTIKSSSGNVSRTIEVVKSDV